MSVDKTLDERGSRYGDFTDHARICQALKDEMVATEGWQRLNDVQRQALEVITDKIARILNGDPNYADNWHDIQGYAKLVEDRLPKQGVKDVKPTEGKPGHPDDMTPISEFVDRLRKSGFSDLTKPAQDRPAPTQLKGCCGDDIREIVAIELTPEMVSKLIQKAEAEAEAPCGCPACTKQRARGH